MLNKVNTAPRWLIISCITARYEWNRGEALRWLLVDTHLDFLFELELI